MVEWCDGHDWCLVVAGPLTSSDGTEFALDSGLRRNQISFDLATGKVESGTMFRWYGQTGMALDVDVLFHCENLAAHALHQGTVDLRRRIGIR